jgi:FkbM family methyltransferase
LKFKHVIKNLFSGVTLRIRSGPLKGKRWIATSGKKFITGKFEEYKTQAFLEHFKKGSIFYDIGAHIGYFSAIACSINRESGHVYAFEPRPDNARFYLKHMAVNGFSNFTLTKAAVAAQEGSAKFNANTGTATGHLSDSGNLTVDVVSIDNLVRENKLPAPDFIKIDVEGGEIEVLKGCQQVIAQHKPKLLIATHSPETHAYVVDFLNRHSYRFTILNQDGIKGDTEIMAVA